MKEVRTRFAPSPTGYMHVGNLRSAIFTYLVAKANDGKFILRIEDTDQQRKVDGAVDFIFDTLALCGIVPDESPKRPGEYGPYTQSERLGLYQKYAEELVEKGHAYYCFCDEERLEGLREKAVREKVPFFYDRHCYHMSQEEKDQRIAKGEKYVIRQLVPDEGVSTYHDLVYGDISVENKNIEDQILLKSDGYPTYNFANVIDDHLMNITYITRGNEYLSSTPKYNLLYEAFGWEKPNYIHLPMVLGDDGQKLSKRNGDASFMDLYDQGYLPEAIVNYLVLLGWTDVDNQELFTMEELKKKFSVERIGKAPATFDIKKLNWVNAHYMKQLDEDTLYKLTVPHLQEAYGKEYAEDWLRELVKLYQKEISYGKEIVDVTALFFKKEVTLDAACQEFMEQDGIRETLDVFLEEITNIMEWTVEAINEAIQKTKEKTGVKGKLLFMPIRIQTTGQMHGPELSNSIHLIGKDTVIARLKQ